MSSSPPSDPWSSKSADDDVNEPELDDPEPDNEDTGPVHVATPPSPPSDTDWDSGQAQDTWAGRFDAPLTVSPRPVPSRRPKSKIVPGAVAAVFGVAIIGGLVFWLMRPSSDGDSPSAETNADPTTSTSTSPVESVPDNPDESRLLRMLPPGYPPDSCEAVAAPEGALAQMNCDKNSDPGAPASAVYSLARDKAALDAAFNDSVQTADRVNCPGNIQSPGPWRRNATPDKVSGTLFCGLREGQPTVIWTDDARLMVSAVQAGPEGPTFPQLYAWWSSHS